MLSQQSQEHNHTPTAWTGLLSTLGQSYHSIKSRPAGLCNHFIPQAAHIGTVYPLSKITYLSIALLYILMSLFMPFYSICSCLNCEAFFFKMQCMSECPLQLYSSINQTYCDTVLPGRLFIYPYNSWFQFFQCWSSVFCLSFDATFLFWVFLFTVFCVAPLCLMSQMRRLHVLWFV